MTLKKNKIMATRTMFLIILSLLAINIGNFNSSVYGKEEITKQPVPTIDSTYHEWYQNNYDYAIDHLNHSKIKREVKGLYVTGNTAGSDYINHLVDLLNKTQLNSLVIDVKEDRGYLTFKSNNPLIKEIGSDRRTFIEDIDGLLHKLKENNIYTIARIVTFKDPFYAGSKPQNAIQKKTGGVWRDNNGVSWVDPYKKQVWDYDISIAKEAAEKGFNEIQFDYIRFPENGAKVNREATFDNPNHLSKAEVIASFLAYSKEQLKDYPVFISADVFGLTTSAAGDMGIGQNWDILSPIIDYISPMMYPSHYGKRVYGIPIPDANPYDVIKYGIIDAKKKNEKIIQRGETPAIIRPWYQDFTAKWVNGHITYGPKEVLQQIKAGNDLNVNQYIMWNVVNRYSEKAWIK